MTVPECPVHHVRMEARPAEPRARCLHCGYVTRHLSFDRCRDCGQVLHVEEPEPRWHCPRCVSQ